MFHACLTRRRPSAILAALSLLAAPSLSAETYDLWCAAHFSPAQIAAGLASPLHDGDEDHCTNLIEYLGGTDPRDRHSRVLLTPDPASPGAILFPLAGDREDVVYEVVVSADLKSWSPDAALLCAGPVPSWSLNGFSFVRLGVKRRIGYILDSDQDGLDDLFEESLVGSDPLDLFSSIGDIDPDDDFDDDGTSNRDDPANAPEPLPAGGATALLIDPALLNCLLDTTPLPEPKVLVVHTPLH